MELAVGAFERARTPTRVVSSSRPRARQRHRASRGRAREANAGRARGASTRSAMGNVEKGRTRAAPGRASPCSFFHHVSARSSRTEPFRPRKGWSKPRPRPDASCPERLMPSATTASAEAESSKKPKRVFVLGPMEARVSGAGLAYANRFDGRNAVRHERLVGFVATRSEACGAIAPLSCRRSTTLSFPVDPAFVHAGLPSSRRFHLSSRVTLAGRTVSDEKSMKRFLPIVTTGLLALRATACVGNDINSNSPPRRWRRKPRRWEARIGRRVLADGRACCNHGDGWRVDDGEGAACRHLLDGPPSRWSRSDCLPVSVSPAPRSAAAPPKVRCRHDRSQR